MDKIWLKSYPANVKHEIDPNEYSSLSDLLNQAFQKHGDTPFSVCMERWMSYRELDQLSQALGAWFQAQGLPAGSRIALMLPNLPQFSVTMAAVLRAGYTCVNVNPLVHRTRVRASAERLWRIRHCHFGKLCSHAKRSH